MFTWRYTKNQGYSESLVAGVAEAKVGVADDNSQKMDVKDPENIPTPAKEGAVSAAQDNPNPHSYHNNNLKPGLSKTSNPAPSYKHHDNHPESYTAQEPSREMGLKFTESSNSNGSKSSDESWATSPMDFEKVSRDPTGYSPQPDRFRETPIIPVVTTTSKKKGTDKPSAETAQSYYQLGIIAFQEGDLPEAERFFRETLKHTPNDIDALLNLATVYIRQKRMESANQTLKMVRQLDPDNVKSLNNLGYVALNRQDFKEARLYYEAVLKINPVDEMALINLACVAQAENNQAEASELYNKIISLNPENGTALIKAAHILTQEGKIDQAIEFYNRSLSLKSVQNDQELAQKIKQRIRILANYK